MTQKEKWQTQTDKHKIKKTDLPKQTKHYNQRQKNNLL